MIIRKMCNYILSIFTAVVPKYFVFLPATESLMSGGGSSRRGSYDTEYSDDNGDSRQNTPKSRSFKISSTPPKKKDLARKTT